MKKFIINLLKYQRYSPEDELIKKIFKNSSILLLGNIISSILGVISIILTAKSLGAEQFGILILITTYVLIIDKLVNFQSWQAIIKYGAGALEMNKSNDFKSLLKFGFTLDISTAIIGTFIAVITVSFMGKWLHWEQDHITYAIFYSFIIISHINGTPIAILRLFGNFKAIATQQVIASLIKLVGVSIAWISNIGLYGFLIIWAITDVAGNLLLIHNSKKELKNQKIRHIFFVKKSKIKDQFQGIWGFLWTTQIHSSVKIGLNDLDIIIIGILTGPSNAGIYKMVKTMGGLFARISDPLYQTILPEFSRLIVRNDYGNILNLIKKPIKFISLFSILSISIFYFFGEKIITLILTDEYIDAYLPAIFYLIAISIGMVTFSFHPFLLAHGKAFRSLLILIISTFFYVPALIYGVENLSLIGASLSYIFFYVCWSLMQLFSVSTIVKEFKNESK
ncbi:MAG: oligosaccharide flippase family protein [Candidatus Thiocaldithrix dubininis]|uniref:Oligosaccharide flippase family protein n=1 Tax=Candidatus Thiocaldithrix dubininis TaxID=3080823 RepID=A0AA95H964_9GAMM|nr:MAG: oligosaccharide flippase family protein [Candidatus Thiocaldithrix dubininis]